MIIGGVDAVCVTNSARTDVYQYYFPMLITVGSAPIDNAFRNRTPIKYSASCRIRNVADNGWVDIKDATSFQISGNKNGGGSANITIRKPELWSIDGPENPELLAPSGRILQIFCTIKIRAAAYTIQMFSGQIENYSESHGHAGGSINVTAKSSAIALENRPTQNLASKTVYTRISEELAASGLFSAGQVPVIFFEDYLLTTQLNFASIASLIGGLAPVAVDISTRSTGGLIIQPRGQLTDETQSFTLEDGNQTTVTRSKGSASSYNRIVVVGMSGETITTQTVESESDISKRGVYQYPYRYGNPERDIADNVSDAENWLSEMLRGKLSAQMQMNPFLGVGTILGFSSKRLFITNGRVKVGSFTHGYSRGNAVTTVYDMAVL